MDLMDYRRKIIANSPHLSSASGDIVSFSDGADLPLKSLIVDIDPVQSGTGDPSPSNVRHISGWDSVKLTRCGKNLLPLNIWSGFSYNQSAGQVFTPTLSDRSWTQKTNSISYTTSSTYTALSLMTPLLPAGDYYVSMWKVSSGRLRATKYVLDASMTVKEAQASSSIVNGWHQAVTLNSDGYIAFYLDNGSEASQTVEIQFQITAGNTESAYEPYNGVNVAIDLGQTVYGGTLNPLTGVLTVDRRFLVLSSSGSGTYGYNSTYGQLRITGLKAMSNTIENICSHYKSFSGSFANLPDKRFMASSSTIAIKDSNYTSLASWKSYLDAQLSANTPVQACVILQAEEVNTIQLTPHQIRTLYGNNTIFADTGNVALEYWAHQ